jgi:hypothetical protein
MKLKELLENKMDIGEIEALERDLSFFSKISNFKENYIFNSKTKIIIVKDKSISLLFKKNNTAFRISIEELEEKGIESTMLSFLNNF